MAAATVPSGPLQDAAAELARALQRAHAMSADEVIAPMKQTMVHILEAAKEYGILQVKLERETRQWHRVLEANSTLSKRLLNAEMASENLVRDIAPALDHVNELFRRAIAHQQGFLTKRTPHVPTGSADQATAESVEAIREAPIEAFEGAQA